MTIPTSRLGHFGPKITRYRYALHLHVDPPTQVPPKRTRFELSRSYLFVSLRLHSRTHATIADGFEKRLEWLPLTLWTGRNKRLHTRVLRRSRPAQCSTLTTPAKVVAVQRVVGVAEGIAIALQHVRLAR